MARSRFVTPDTQRLILSDGDWVLVKRRLNLAEAKRLESAIFSGIRGTREITEETKPEDVEVRLDSAAAFMTKLQVYLVDWSFCNVEGKPVKCTYAAIDNLDPETAEEIMMKLNEFLDQEAKAREDPTTATISEAQSA